MAMPAVIRDPRVIANVYEVPHDDEADLVVNWDRHPVEIGIEARIPEVQKHWMLVEQLLRLAEHVALRDGAIRRAAPREYLDQVGMKLFWLLVYSGLYRPVSCQEGEEFMEADRKSTIAEARRNRARPPRRAGPDVIDLATRQKRMRRTPRSHASKGSGSGKARS